MKGRGVRACVCAVYRNKEQARKAVIENWRSGTVYNENAEEELKKQEFYATQPVS